MSISLTFESEDLVYFSWLYVVLIFLTCCILHFCILYLLYTDRNTQKAQGSGGLNSMEYQGWRRQDFICETSKNKKEVAKLGRNSLSLCIV